MPTVKEREKAMTKEQEKAAAVAFFDAKGTEVKTREKATVTPEATATTVSLTLHNGTVSFEMNVEINPNSYPFAVLGGEITSGICGAPWSITGGYLGQDFRLDATRQGSGSCANSIIVVGEYQNPSSYRGTYGFNGASSSFRHTTLYHC